MSLKHARPIFWTSSIVFGSAIFGHALPLPVVRGYSSDGDICGFDGNSDLYGLGIRLGVYFQWTSASLIYSLGLDGRDEIMESYVVFLIALTTAIIVITAQSQPAYAVEIFILTYIIFGGAYTVFNTGYMRINIIEDFQSGGQKRKLRAVVIMVTLAAASIYCCWFWLRGIFDHFLPTPCGTYGFLLVKVSLLNPSVAKFFAFCSIFVTAAETTWPLTIQLLPRMGRLMNQSKVKEVKIDINVLSGVGGFRPVPSYLGPVISAATIVWSILGIELTLHWNSIKGVYSIGTTGQLIPFITGIMGFIVILLNAAAKIMGHPHESDEATAAKKRLGYLDLIKPVEPETVRRSRRYVRKWRKQQKMLRNRI